jgi:hypothetical protein
MHGTASHDLIWRCLYHRATHVCGRVPLIRLYSCARRSTSTSAYRVVRVRYKLCTSTTYNAHYSSIYAVVTVIGIGAEAVQHP